MFSWVDGDPRILAPLPLELLRNGLGKAAWLLRSRPEQLLAFDPHHEELKIHKPVRRN